MLFSEHLDGEINDDWNIFSKNRVIVGIFHIEQYIIGLDALIYALFDVKSSSRMRPLQKYYFIIKF